MRRSRLRSRTCDGSALTDWDTDAIKTPPLLLNHTESQDAHDFLNDAAVVCKSAGTASTSPVIGCIDFGGAASTPDGTFRITWDATGVLVPEVT